MHTFHYIARSADGSIQRGSIDAETKEHAREQLRTKGFMVESLQSDAPPQETAVLEHMPWTVTEDETPPGKPATVEEGQRHYQYVPLTDTLRLFAGWLLAWYAAVYIAGSLQATGRISKDIPLLQELFTSWLVLRFTFGIFLFLALTSLQKAIRGSAATGAALAVLWLVLVVLFHLNA